MYFDVLNIVFAYYFLYNMFICAEMASIIYEYQIIGVKHIILYNMPIA